MGWTVLPHPTYSPHLAPTDYHLLGPLKDTPRDRRFVYDDDLKHSAREELQRFSKHFYATGAQRLTQRWKSLLITKQSLWKK
jgi:hypothetical protein